MHLPAQIVIRECRIFYGSWSLLNTKLGWKYLWRPRIMMYFLSSYHCIPRHCWISKNDDISYEWKHIMCKIAENDSHEDPINKCWTQLINADLVCSLVLSSRNMTLSPHFKMLRISLPRISMLWWLCSENTENTEYLLLMNDFSFSLPCWGHLLCLLAYFWTLNSLPK